MLLSVKHFLLCLYEKLSCFFFRLFLFIYKIERMDAERKKTRKAFLFIIEAKNAYKIFC